MGRHSSPKVLKGTELESARKVALQALFDLEAKNRQHLIESMTATRICNFCLAGKAPKVDNDKNCLQCHGTNVVPDVARRNWAYEEIQSRVLPKPKSVEMQMDSEGVTEQTQKELENLSTKDLEKMLDGLGVK